MTASVEARASAGENAFLPSSHELFYEIVAPVFLTLMKLDTPRSGTCIAKSLLTGERLLERPATVRLKAARIPCPAVSVTCEDVTIGHPHSQCYELAARKLRVNVKECVVVEGAAGSILAARGAAAPVTLRMTSGLHVHFTSADAARSSAAIRLFTQC